MAEGAAGEPGSKYRHFAGVVNMARPAVIKEDHVLECMRNNQVALTLMEILDRIKAQEGWSFARPEDLQEVLDRLSGGDSPMVRRDVGGDSVRFSLVLDEEKGFSTERDLDAPLIQWLGERMDVKAVALASGAGSGGEESGTNEWRYPDLVGHRRYNVSPGLTQFFEKTASPSIEVLSFEVKKELNRSNIRRFFFQTLANSAWANQRYLAAAHITEDAVEEFRKLARSYGMGLIRITPGREGNRIVCLKGDLLFESPVYPLDVETVKHLYNEIKWKPFCNWIDHFDR